MDRRSFLVRAGALLGALRFGSVAAADEPAAKQTGAKSDKKAAKKTAKPKKPPLPFVPGSWTLVILPDTQNYSTYFPGLLELQTRWIAENKDEHNIVYVLQNGDVTNRNSRIEWQRASRAMGLLDSAVPYAIVPGNHDYGERGKTENRATKMNDYFPPSRFERWPTFGGTMEPGRIENNYHLFEAGGKRWLVVGLEWGPRNKTLQWADTILAKHADRKAIIVTHAYMYSDSTRYDWAAKGRKQRWNPHTYPTAADTNDGEDIWQKLAKKHANVVLVNNGHVLNDGLGFQVSQGAHGNQVNQMLCNYQMLPIGGGGWLRLLEFLPDGKTVQAKTYSPLYEQYETGAENQFVFTAE